MQHSPPRRSRYKRRIRDCYTLGGPLFYATLIPALVLFLTVPALATAFTFGATTVFSVSRIGHGGRSVSRRKHAPVSKETTGTVGKTSHSPRPASFRPNYEATGTSKSLR